MGRARGIRATKPGLGPKNAAHRRLVLKEKKMVFNKIGHNNVYLVAAVYSISSRKYFCRYAEFVGHKKDIMSILNRDIIFKPNYSEYSFPSLEYATLKIFVTKLPSGLFHYGIMDTDNTLLSSVDSDNIPKTQLFHYLNKATDTPLLLNWMPYVSAKLISAKQIDENLNFFGGVRGWTICPNSVDKLPSIIEQGLKSGKISDAVGREPVNEYPIPDYAIDKEELAGLPKKDKLALKEITTDGLWSKGIVQAFLTKPSVTIPSPIMPLRNGHVGLIFASGNLNNAILKNGKEKVLIKYSAEKILADKTQEKDKEVKREFLRSVIKYIDFSDNSIKTIQSDQI